MPQDARFVGFVAGRYPSIGAYSTVAFALAVLAGASLLRVEWGPNEWTLVAGIAAAFVVVQLILIRYYAREFGIVKALEADKREPWYFATALAFLESGLRRFGHGALESGLLTLGLALGLALHGFRERHFRPYLLLGAAVLVYLGVDRLTASHDVEFWTWLQRAAVIFALTLVVMGVSEHLLLRRALSPETRRLALSSVPAPLAYGLPALARDPIGATMLTALERCDEADVTFLGNIAGLRREEASSWIESLKVAGLVWIEEERPRFVPPRQMVRLSIDGRDVVRRLWE